MSTVFAVPCPGCGQQMWITADGDVACAACDRQYHARMGVLFLTEQHPGPAPRA
jgi:uncharacterized Zn finger protein (UPF0148 family)